jgi:hypothetical protein
VQQSNVIFAAILIAYIIFITMRGELSSYIELLKGNTAGANSGLTIGGINLGSLGNSVSSLFSQANALSGSNTTSIGGGNTSTFVPAGGVASFEGFD